MYGKEKINEINKSSKSTVECYNLHPFAL